MSSIEINASSTVCRKCGTAYNRLKGFFPVSYAHLYRGTGYLPYCRECVDGMFASYASECGNTKDAVRQMCRKLDLYWNDKLFDSVEQKSAARSIMTSYIAKTNNAKYAGKSYDDTLKEDGSMWEWSVGNCGTGVQSGFNHVEDIDVDPSVEAFWGTGYTPEMYRDLEQRREYWMSKYPDGYVFDIGLEALIRQICALELDINRDRAEGKSVEKSVSALNNLLGSAMLKPAQKTDSGDAALEKVPFGVWIDRWENKRPVPEPDPEFQDVDGIKRYISIWFLGHACKMLGIKNTYCKLYEDEISKLRVEHPEYEEDDDETLFNDIFGSSTYGGDDE